MIIANFRHQPGHHCASTALSDVMHYQHHPLSEALCFGLGAGLGFSYWEAPDRTPSRVLGYRTPRLEANFFRHLLGRFAWRESDYFPWAEMKGYLDDHIPILLLTDLYYLPHYGQSVHFPGHSVVLCGYEPSEAGEVAYLADTGFPDLKPVPIADLAAAMDSPLPPIPVHNHWYPVEPFSLPDLQGPVQRAVRANAEAMLDRSRGNIGLAGMEMAVASLSDWAEIDDWAWCARFAYQVIERRGTGGGAFRKLYSQFLTEAAVWLPGLVTANAPERMLSLAQKWTDLSDLFKAISEQDRPDRFDQAARQIEVIMRLEEKLFADILAVV